MSVLGEQDVIIQDELYVNEAHILPHKNIIVSSLDTQIVIFHDVLLDVKIIIIALQGGMRYKTHDIS